MQSNTSQFLQLDFFTRNDVVLIAKELLGKKLFTSVNNQITSGIIIETEAYAGSIDKASHAFNNRRTSRTEIMFKRGGCAYVYLCYGIHSLFNIVTSVDGEPHAVLIRGILPVDGIEIMKERTGKISLLPKNGIGPGNVSKLMGIQVSDSGRVLSDESISERKIWVQDEGILVKEEEIKIGPRIGVDYAGEDALLPYRFQWLKNK